MKSIATFVTLCAIALTSFTACEKEQLADTSGNAVHPGLTKEGPTDPHAPQFVWKFVRTHEGEPGCPDAGSNCSKISFLVANNDHGVGAVLQAITSGIPEQVRTAFEEHRATLLEVMTETDIDGVINGEFTAQAETDRNGTTFTSF